MMRISNWLLSVAVALTLPLCGTAKAATYTYDFVANGFLDDLNPKTTAPVDPVTGSFTITFDTTQSYTNETSGITLSSNLPITGPLAFNYNPAGSGGEGTLSLGSLITFGGLTNGNVANVATTTNDFLFTITHFLTSPVGALFDYSQNGVATSYSTGKIALSTAVTPIPASLPLMASGLLALGGFGWFRNRRRIATGRASPLAA